MEKNNLFIGNVEIKSQVSEVKGEFVKINNEDFYKISNYNGMQPFFITVASDSDHWMYISSTGSLSAGRKNPDSALFPYYTDDKIIESNEITGSKTILHINQDGKKMLWEPFSDRYSGAYSIERNIYKNTMGNKLLFEETNNDLGLTFSYCWMNSEKFGWVKRSKITNNTDKEIELELIDGLQNILPYGATRLFQNTYSTLADAYKKNELIKGSKLALFRMESIPVDKAEPSESLKVTTVWSHGIDDAKFLLTSKQLDNFRKGNVLSEENESKGERGAFFTNFVLKLAASSNKEWYTVAELNQDSVKVNNLIDYISKAETPVDDIEKDIERGGLALKAIIAEADGIQQTDDKFNVARHYSNTLFNVMRGGIYSEGYTIDTNDFSNHVKHFNKSLWNDKKAMLSELPATINYSELIGKIEATGNADLKRLCLEYLPLTFSRRHGDPSRPWNLFSIDIKEADGSKKLAYQGNWRDIFQNWEALSLSFPEFINGIIAKFVNATTADGYNPYRITRDGIDWEIIDPDDPWSNIGYWGDHQIIYLQKLLEVSQKYFPGKLDSWLNEKLFAFANVPYKIKAYKDILAHPQDSMDFDEKLHEDIEALVKEFGSDAKLLLDSNKQVLKANLTEKLLATFLAKMSNFIPEAGIWMNTLRPEWNDANNALVGFGVSMVTLYYMRRFVVFAEELFKSSECENFNVSEEMSEFFSNINQALINNSSSLSNGFDNSQRKQLTDLLGVAGETYRNKVYKGHSGANKEINKSEIVDFFNTCKSFIDQSIETNKREDGMYNAYNIISIGENEIGIRYLYEMLEGQVSVLSAGKLSAKEAVEVLDAMRESALYREDQESYILYPNKTLAKFLDKNNIPDNSIKKLQLLTKLIVAGDTSIINKDVNGSYHFNGSFNNAEFLKEGLQKIKESGIDFTDNEEKEVLDIYESIFDHQSFTGRSGSFYKYEGLGSIYWHMVSKLLLAVGEYIEDAIKGDVSPETLDRLLAHYEQIKTGIGAHKSPKDYGSFPFDAYSHTPMMTGVQQPGMTGQVKEDVISRFMELGVQVTDGQISFKPAILKKSEYLAEPSDFVYYDVNRNNKTINLDKKSLAFTYCQVPVIYKISDSNKVSVILSNGKKGEIDGLTLDNKLSNSLFKRTGEIEKIEVCIKF